MIPQSEEPPSDKGNDQLVNSPAGPWELLLRKYVHVWLWSILFGTSTGLLYTLTDFRVGDWKGLGFLITIPAVLAAILALQSWLHLYSALRVYLLPEFTGTRKPDEKVFSWHLTRSFFYLILASVFRIAIGIIDFALSTLGSLS